MSERIELAARAEKAAATAAALVLNDRARIEELETKVAALTTMLALTVETQKPAKKTNTTPHSTMNARAHSVLAKRDPLMSAAAEFAAKMKASEDKHGEEQEVRETEMKSSEDKYNQEQEVRETEIHRHLRALGLDRGSYPARGYYYDREAKKVLKMTGLQMLHAKLL